MPSSAVQKRALDRKSTRLNSSHGSISYAVFCLKKNFRLPHCLLPEGLGQLGPSAYMLPPRPRTLILLGRVAASSFFVVSSFFFFFFFFNDPPTPEIYTFSPPGALPI